MREFVAAGMDTELEIGGQSVGGDGMADSGHIERHLAGELAGVAHVVHALVEAAAEFGSDGLDRNAFIGNGGEDDEQLRRRLGGICLVHRDLGNEVYRCL